MRRYVNDSKYLRGNRRHLESLTNQRGLKKETFDGLNFMLDNDVGYVKTWNSTYSNIYLEILNWSAELPKD